MKTWTTTRRHPDWSKGSPWSQTLFSLLVSGNKTRASVTGVRAGREDAICVYCAAIMHAGYSPAESWSGGFEFQCLERSGGRRGFTARRWLSQMMEHRAGAEVKRSSVSGQCKYCSISDPPSQQAWCHLIESVIRNTSSGFFSTVFFL